MSKKDKGKLIEQQKNKPKKQVPVSGHYGQKNIQQNLNPDSFWYKTPTWSFSRIDTECWTIHNSFIDSILEKLISYEKMTWSDISQTTRNGANSHNTSSHNIPTEKLIKPAQKRLEELKIYEDEIFSLSLSNKERLWGILDSGILRIIWYDYNHEICPSTKKHT